MYCTVHTYIHTYIHTLRPSLHDAGLHLTAFNLSRNEKTLYVVKLPSFSVVILTALLEDHLTSPGVPWMVWYVCTVCMYGMYCTSYCTTYFLSDDGDYDGCLDVWMSGRIVT